MKKVIIIITFVFSASLALGQINKESSFKAFKIDKKLKSKIKKAKASSDVEEIDIDDCFFFFSDSLDSDDLIPSSNVRGFYDTLTTYVNIGCDCMIRNDTVILQGGIAYDGGIGFDVRITKKGFNGNIWISGKGYKIDSTTDFQEEIVLKSIFQTLKIQDRKALAFGKTLVGEIFMESEKFIGKDNPMPNKLYMKILFCCKLDESIAF